MRRVMKSQTLHILCQSSNEGRPYLVLWSDTTEGESSSGNENAGRSRSQSE